MVADLVNRRELEALLKKAPESLEGNAYADVMTQGASEVVRNAAFRPTWGAEPLAVGETLAPPRARIIALHLAAQAFQDRGNLRRRTAGPISETFAEDGAHGFDLGPGDMAWLEGQRPVAQTGDQWVLRHHQASGRRRPHYGDETPDGYSFLAGDMNFSHGLDMTGGPRDAGSW